MELTYNKAKIPSSPPLFFSPPPSPLLLVPICRSRAAKRGCHTGEKWYKSKS